MPVPPRHAGRATGSAVPGLDRRRWYALAASIVAGVLVGPHTPGFVADGDLALELSELGVILLMFGVGLHFSMRDLISVRKIAVPGALVREILEAAHRAPSGGHQRTVHAALATRPAASASMMRSRGPSATILPPSTTISAPVMKPLASIWSSTKLRRSSAACS